MHFAFFAVIKFGNIVLPNLHQARSNLPKTGVRNSTLCNFYSWEPGWGPRSDALIIIFNNFICVNGRKLPHLSERGTRTAAFGFTGGQCVGYDNGDAIAEPRLLSGTSEPEVAKLFVETTKIFRQYQDCLSVPESAIFGKEGYKAQIPRFKQFACQIPWNDFLESIYLVMYCLGKELDDGSKERKPD